MIFLKIQSRVANLVADLLLLTPNLKLRFVITSLLSLGRNFEIDVNISYSATRWANLYIYNQ